MSELPTTGATFQGRQIIAGRYEIRSKLGQGGMGEVWHTYDVKLSVDVALKSIRMDLQREQDPLEALRRIAAQFLAGLEAIHQAGVWL